MFRKTCTLGIILVLALYIIKCVFILLSGIELADFKQAGVIFLLDTSASNKNLQARQEKTIVKMCKSLDVDDKAIIYVVTENTFQIYNGNPHKVGVIKKAFEERAKLDSKSWGTAYGAAIKQAVDDALALKNQGFKPSIVILGDLENEGDIKKQINWNKLPSNMKKTLKYLPDLSVVFLYAHPEKLDMARNTLKTVFPANQLFFASEENVELTVKGFMKSVH